VGFTAMLGPLSRIRRDSKENTKLAMTMSCCRLIMRQAGGRVYNYCINMQRRTGTPFLPTRPGSPG